MKLVNKSEPQVLALRMPRAKAITFLTALRSGKYKQGRYTLRTFDGKYCCLGVLQHCLTGEIETVTSLINGKEEPRSTPTLKWAKTVGIQGKDELSLGHEFGMDPMLTVGETQRQAFLPTTMRATHLNDVTGLTFKEIADIFEQNIEVYVE